MESKADRVRRLQAQCRLSEEAKAARPFLAGLFPQLRAEYQAELEAVSKPGDVLQFWSMLKALRKIEDRLNTCIRESERNQKLLNEATEE